MAASTFAKTFRDGSLVITDNTGTPKSLTVPYENGDLSASGLGKGLRETNPIQSRGNLVTVRKGNRVFPQVTFSVIMTHFTSATQTSIIDCIEKTGDWTNAVSTLSKATAIPGDADTRDLTFTVEGTTPDSADHTCVMTKVELEYSFSEGDPNTVNVTGTIYGTITYT